MTRRELLMRAAVVGGAFAGSPWLRALAAEPESRWFKIGVCDWSIGKMSDTAAFSIAKELGLDGVQVSLGTVENDMHLRKPEMQQAFRKAAAAQDVEVASLAIGAMNSVPYKSDPRAEVWVRDSVAACTGLGVEVVLLAFFSKGDLRDDPEGVDVVVERLKKVAPLAEEAGVLLGIESWLDARQHLDIIERVGSSNVKVYYDVGNSHLR